MDKRKIHGLTINAGRALAGPNLDFFFDPDVDLFATRRPVLACEHWMIFGVDCFGPGAPCQCVLDVVTKKARAAGLQGHWRFQAGVAQIERSLDTVTDSPPFEGVIPRSGRYVEVSLSQVEFDFEAFKPNATVRPVKGGRIYLWNSGSGILEAVDHVKAETPVSDLPFVHLTLSYFLGLYKIGARLAIPSWPIEEDPPPVLGNLVLHPVREEAIGVLMPVRK